MNWSGRTSQIVDLVYFQKYRLTNIMQDKVEVLLRITLRNCCHLIHQMANVILGSSQEIINTDNVVSLAIRFQRKKNHLHKTCA